MTPCPQSEYFDDVTDPRYSLIPGGYAVSQERFELDNGLADIWSIRYTQDEPEKSLLRQVRKDITLFPFSRPVLGYALSCELDPEKLSREEAYEQIISKQLKSQEPEIGAEERAFVIAVLAISIFLIGLVMILTCSSGYQKGIDEDDGFWENYNRWTKSHLFISLSLLVILALSAPISYEFVITMLETMKDKEFF